MSIKETASDLERQWATDPRWAGVVRPYSGADVLRLRGTVQEEHTLARLGAERLWALLAERDYVPALGALTGGQAVQSVKAGLEAIYLSGWQVAADANSAGQTYPDQSLYPVDSVPKVVRRINNALLRADRIEHSEGNDERHWLAPIVADAEAGFGGPLNAYELMSAMIAAGAAGVHWEDQLASEKKCGHLGGKVLIPVKQHIRTLTAARLAADVAGVPDARGGPDRRAGRDAGDQRRGRAGPAVPHRRADRRGLLPGPRRGWTRRSCAAWPSRRTRTCSGARPRRPDLGQAKEFAEAIHAQFPDKMLAYNCSPSFNWRRHLDDADIARFQRELGAMGYAFQFITLAGFHALNHSMFDLARATPPRACRRTSGCRRREFAAEAAGYTATRHQREVGTGWFDLVSTVIDPESSTTALAGSTEAAQFAAAH